MQNHVIDVLFKGLPPDFSTVRFNFSGVGRSTGNHKGGLGEVNQVKAVISYMKRDFFKEMGEDMRAWKEIHVVGYSFGAAVSGPVATSDPTITSYSGIAFPFDMFKDLALQTIDAQSKTGVPASFIIGQDDDIANARRLDYWINKFKNPVHSFVIKKKGADHFLFGMGVDILHHVEHFITKAHEDHL